MGVPNFFANATTTIPLAELDQNFATQITLGNTSVGLGNASTTFTPNSVAGIVGTNTNDSVNAGGVGEFITAAIALGSATPLVSTTPKDVTSVPLTAGDWDVRANISFTGGGTTVVMEFDGGINTVSATLPTTGTSGRAQNSYGTAGLTLFAQNNISLNTGPVRISLSGNGTAYLVAAATFTTSTCSAYGEIDARRVR